MWPASCKKFRFLHKPSQSKPGLVVSMSCLLVSVSVSWSSLFCPSLLLMSVCLSACLCVHLSLSHTPSHTSELSLSLSLSLLHTHTHLRTHTDTQRHTHCLGSMQTRSPSVSARCSPPMPLTPSPCTHCLVQGLQAPTPPCTHSLFGTRAPTPSPCTH